MMSLAHGLGSELAPVLAPVLALELELVLVLVLALALGLVWMSGESPLPGTPQGWTPAMASFHC